MCSSGQKFYDLFMWINEHNGNKQNANEHAYYIHNDDHDEIKLSASDQKQILYKILQLARAFPMQNTLNTPTTISANIMIQWIKAAAAAATFCRTY